MALDKSSSRSVIMMDYKTSRHKGLLATTGTGPGNSTFLVIIYLHSSQKKKLIADKREKMEKTSLRAAIFEEFQTGTHLTFKLLSERLQQPDSWLKENLVEICDLNRRGPNIGSYELKAEFKGVGASSSRE